MSDMDDELERISVAWVQLAHLSTEARERALAYIQARHQEIVVEERGAEVAAERAAKRRGT